MQQKDSRGGAFLSEFVFNVVHCAGVKHPAADILSRLPTDCTDKTILKDELPVLVIVYSEKMDDVATSIFELETHTGTSAQSITDADGTHVSQLALAELLIVQSGDERCQNAARHTGHAGTEFTLNKTGVLVRSAPIDRSLQKLAPRLI